MNNEENRNSPFCAANESPQEDAKPVFNRRIHMCLDVRGAIHNRDFGWFVADDGSKVSKREALEYLLDHVAQGHKVIPIGQCDNFSYETGCMGHALPVTVQLEEVR